MRGQFLEYCPCPGVYYDMCFSKTNNELRKLQKKRVNTRKWQVAIDMLTIGRNMLSGRSGRKAYRIAL